MKALENLWRRLYRVPQKNAQTKKGRQRRPFRINGLRSRLLLRSFSQHRYLDMDNDVGVQRDCDGMVSDRFKRSLRQAGPRTPVTRDLLFVRYDARGCRSTTDIC